MRKGIRHGTLGSLAVVLALAAGCSSGAQGVGVPEDETMGGRCSEAAECNDTCVTSGDFPGGICTWPCDRASDCPEGWSCVSNSSGICLQRCGGDDDCSAYGAGWRCNEESQEGEAEKARVCVGQ